MEVVIPAVRMLARTVTRVEGHCPGRCSAAERALRSVALGRKNWLFAGSDAGGQRAAVIYSLIKTAKLNGLDPEAYVRDILGRIAGHPVNRVAELLDVSLARRFLRWLAPEVYRLESTKWMKIESLSGTAISTAIPASRGSQIAPPGADEIRATVW